MSAIAGIPTSVLDSVNGGAAAKKAGAAEAQDRFMTLLVSQMKNQDPLNPLDNAQVTSQLAQLSTVTGIDKLNTTLEALMGSFQAGQSLQAAGMIGRGVLVPGDALRLADAKASFGVELAEPADSVGVTIRDAAGKAVRTLALGAHEAGVLPLAWDGRTDGGGVAADGRYRIEVAAERGGQKSSAGGLAYAEVRSVSASAGGQGARLNLDLGREVALADVRQIL